MFTALELDTLRAKYALIDRVDPEGETYPKLRALLDGMPLATLRQLEGAQIKFVSGLARNARVRKEPRPTRRRLEDV